MTAPVEPLAVGSPLSSGAAWQEVILGWGEGGTEVRWAEEGWGGGPFRPRRGAGMVKEAASILVKIFLPYVSPQVPG